MASPDTLQELAAHPDWIPPRSDLRAFLGEPGAHEATKTTVEPGNAFSPGMRTFGVTWWLRLPESGAFFAPETAPLEDLHWRYEEGHLPLIHCRADFAGLAAEHSLFQDGTAATRSEAVCARLQVTNGQPAPVRAQVFIALRSLGPAGGPIPDLMVGADHRSFRLAQRQLPLLGVDRTPTAIGCSVGDPSPMARQGLVPGEQKAEDHDGWCFGLARFDLNLAPGEAWHLHLDCPLQSYGVLRDDLPGTAGLRPAQFEARAQAHLAGWRARLSGVEIQVPDVEFRNAFYAGLQHMLTATVGDQARIAPLSYPLPWLRDSVYIIRCFDLAGYHELARAATEYCARHDFFGGFGAEGDGPGQGIWALVQHYRITRDRAWLARVFPDIRRKCDWLRRMRRTREPIAVLLDTPVFAWTQAARNSGVICLAARDGIIRGIMDGGVDYSLGWVNHWALAGLQEAAFAAQELGSDADAAACTSEAAELRAALEAYIGRNPEFLDHERTVNSLLWPTRAWEAAPERIAAGFDAWWLGHRGTAGDYRAEPYWLYFEFAQAHNALLLGQRERAWQVLQHRLQHQDLPGLYGWREGGDGVGTENAVLGVTLINQLRGCQRFESITPHGWSQAEMWLLQRAALVEEWQGELLLFAGVPPHWLPPGGRLAFSGLPTWYGRACAELQVDAAGEEAEVTASGLRPGTRVRIRLPRGEAVAHVGAGPLIVRVPLAPA